MLIPFGKCSLHDILMDINKVIRKEGKDEIRYELAGGHNLVIQVLASTNGDDLELSVERLDEFGNTVKAATDDYKCSNENIVKMLKNVLLTE